MKYLKLYESFSESFKFSDLFKKDINSLCRKYRITDYTINNDIIDVNGHVNFFNKRLKKLPLKFGNVNGTFDCSANKLISLEGSPKNLNGPFICNRNKLTSLKRMSNESYW
jgi:hypothetical protein